MDFSSAHLSSPPAPSCLSSPLLQQSQYTSHSYHGSACFCSVSHDSPSVRRSPSPPPPPRYHFFVGPFLAIPEKINIFLFYLPFSPSFMKS